MVKIEQQYLEKIFLELESLYLSSQGHLLKLYYKYINKKIFEIMPLSRQWEYTWAIINADITKGLNVLDAGCGGSPLLSYLYKKGCRCFGIDYEFWYETSFSNKNIEYPVIGFILKKL